ncbi:MAG TPA: AAA family ATPase, partial [Ktedonobacteraceae bacterium]|nr:AAA family ATPase [Ktedonobacteraceae bacterium]
MIGGSISLIVTTLGRFSIFRDQDLLSGGNWNRRRVCELFKLLLSAEQHRLHREQVQELLWPSSSMEQAANSFGKTLYLLRRALEPDLATGKSSTYVSLDHDILLLVPGSLQIDVDLFESMAKQVQVNMHSGPIKEQQLQSTLDGFDKVLALYGGDYLPDDLYEDWAHRRRDRLRRTYSWLLEQAAKVALAGSQGQHACEYLRALLECNNTDEHSHRELMLIYARMGRRREALNQYSLLREALEEELGANPLPETVELYHAIQSGSIPVDLAESLQVASRKPTIETFNASPHIHPQAVSDEHKYEIPIAVVPKTEVNNSETGTTPIVSQIFTNRILQSALVGRADEIKKLQQAYTSIREGQQRVLFVNGEAGIGKTRLAREFSSWMEEQGATVLWGNCYEMSGALPYQPIIDMLTGHIRSSSPDQLRAVLGNSTADLAKIIPELRIKLPDLPSLEPLGPEVERRNLYNAIAGYFNAIASERSLLLILDDLQWADTATMQLLNYLLLQSANQGWSILPYFLLLYRADEVHETHLLRSLLSSQMRTGHAEEIRLKRLKKDEVLQLLIQMAGHTVSTTFSEEICKHTE